VFLHGLLSFISRSFDHWRLFDHSWYSSFWRRANVLMRNNNEVSQLARVLVERVFLIVVNGGGTVYEDLVSVFKTSRKRYAVAVLIDVIRLHRLWNPLCELSTYCYLFNITFLLELVNSELDYDIFMRVNGSNTRYSLCHIWQWRNLIKMCPFVIFFVFRVIFFLQFFFFLKFFIKI